MKARFGKWGPAADYRGAHVVDATGRLATIVGTRTVIDREFVSPEQSTVAILRHFNGEPAGEQPLASLEILERDYEPEPETVPPALRCGLCGADMALDPFHPCKGVNDNG